jgi:hypothetical protein
MAVLTAGCGSPAPTGDVSGRATYNNQPLPSGTVAFYGADGRVESSLISAKGEYHIPFAPCGEVRITVQTPPASTGGGAGRGIPTIEIPKKYSAREESGLTFTVNPGEQSFDIKLTGPTLGTSGAPARGGRRAHPEFEEKSK